LGSPTITFNVVGTTAGTNVVVSVTASRTTATLNNQALGSAAVNCPLSAVLAATEIIVAGAPTAADDSASTQPGQAVTIDVRANDKADTNLAIDETSFAITTPPTKGTASIAGGKIVYTPNAGVQGTTDSLVYKLCSVDDGNSETPIPCDTATVTVTIAAPQAAATTPTTVAAAAALPRTGSSSGPLTGAALALLVLGLAALLAGQSKTAVRRP
jgi:hypothetical protein